MTRKQCVYTGIVVVMVLLGTGLAQRKGLLVAGAALALLFCVTAPRIFTPLAFLWGKLSRFMGMVISRFILVVIFFLVVFPVAMINRATGKDPMMIKQWKNGKGSVFKNRNHTFGPEDLEHPY